MQDKSTISFKVVVNWDKNTVELKESGFSVPISKSYSISGYTIAEAFRNLAYEALRHAHQHEDVQGCAFTASAARMQADRAISANSFSISAS